MLGKKKTVEKATTVNITCHLNLLNKPGVLITNVLAEPTKKGYLLVKHVSANII